MLKVPEHQVAGHIANDGKLGPLVDDEGRFFKPLQGDSRGENEAKFYESFSSNKNVPDHIHGYFPVYHDTQLVEASDGSGKLPHMVLEDVVSGYSNPSIMDVKIGSRTWYPDVSEEYFLVDHMSATKLITKLSETCVYSALLLVTLNNYKTQCEVLVQLYNPDKKRTIHSLFTIPNKANINLPDS